MRLREMILKKYENVKKEVLDKYSEWLIVQ